MADRHPDPDHNWTGGRTYGVRLAPHDVMRGYEINLEYLCRNRRFKPAEVVSSELVIPKGAVPNSMLLWIRIELISGDRKFVTLPLVDFYRYVELPESSIGGWTDGDRGSDYSGLNARYEVDHSGSGEKVSGELLDGAEGSTEAVESAVVDPAEDRQPS
mgnify:CR=1 FL=1